MLNSNIRTDWDDCAGQSRMEAPSASLPPVSGLDLVTAGAQAKVVRKIQKARLRRTDFLSSTLFAEPGWDMLLELFASAVEQKRVTIGELCSASNAPQTTALRWIDVLLREGLVTRRPDPLDGRRIHMEITASAYRAMQDYAAQLSGVTGMQ
jgi:DNA-binding transcriptional ArsR family regulator